MKNLIRFFQEEQGTTAIEYGLIAALISVVAIAAMGVVGGKLTNLFVTVSASLR